MSSSKSSSSSAGGASGPTAADSTAANTHTVEEAEAGQRLDKVLAGQEAVHSREAARRLILGGEVTLNAVGADPDARVREGDEIAFRVPPPVPSTLVPEALPIDVLFEDAHLLVLNKPAGLSVHPGPGHATGTLVHRLLAHCQDLSGIGGVLRPGIVHRLDLDTSGVLAVAKTDAAHLHLAAQFKEHSIQCSYLALVMGHPKAEKGTISLPIGRHRANRIKRAPIATGKHAVTHWQVEQRLGPLTLLRLRLETGRTHQIRVHLSAEGWPVVGDPLYGGPRLKGLNLPGTAQDLLHTFKRQALHAAELGLVHPATGEALHCSAPLPPDFADLLAAVRAAMG